MERQVILYYLAELGRLTTPGDTITKWFAPTADVVIGGLAALWEIRRWPKS